MGSIPRNSSAIGASTRRATLYIKVSHRKFEIVSAWPVCRLAARCLT